MPTFQKKPVQIEAEQFAGNESAQRIALWANGAVALVIHPPGSGSVARLEVATLEGTMTAEPGDWIIRGIQGEFYPCKPDIFEASYERVWDN